MPVSNVNANGSKFKIRTVDVKPKEATDFSGLLLSERVVDGIKRIGFDQPSPIQLEAIPLGKCGLDLVVQAKSGTGKTCVFSVVALEMIVSSLDAVQVLVLAPTREIAHQTCGVISSIGCCVLNLAVHSFIGGTLLSEDVKKLKRCHIAVGTPGRVKQLIKNGHLMTNGIRLFVLDEADKLMENSFQDDINWIYSSLPFNKQMITTSATYPESLVKLLTNYMRNPTLIRLNSDDPALLGIKQYYRITKYHPLPHVAFNDKVECLASILNTVSFNQCLVFCNYQVRAESLCGILTSRGWPTVFISGHQDQKKRLDVIYKLKNFQCRILVSTDLTARGIDAENVNLVVNIDVPYDGETYLHRIGRAGRFGSLAVAVTIVNNGDELDELMSIQKNKRLKLHLINDEIDDLWNIQVDNEIVASDKLADEDEKSPIAARVKSKESDDNLKENDSNVQPSLIAEEAVEDLPAKLKSFVMPGDANFLDNSGDKLKLGALYFEEELSPIRSYLRRTRTVFWNKIESGVNLNDEDVLKIKDIYLCDGDEEVPQEETLGESLHQNGGSEKQIRCNDDTNQSDRSKLFRESKTNSSTEENASWIDDGRSDLIGCEDGTSCGSYGGFNFRSWYSLVESRSRYIKYKTYLEEMLN